MKNVVRRVVTGHNADGKAVIIEDGPTPSVHDDLGQEGLVFMEVWETRATPAPIAPTEPEPTDHPLQLLPPPGGVRIRVLDIPPAGIRSTRTPLHPPSAFSKGSARAAPSTRTRRIRSCTAPGPSTTASCWTVSWC